MTLDEVLNKLRKECNALGVQDNWAKKYPIRYGGQAAWARKHGISLQHVNDVILGVRPPGPKILKALGFKLATRYVTVTYEKE